MKKINFPLVILLLFIFKTIYSQTPQVQFAKHIQSAHNQGVWCRANATDNLGNLYVAGFFHGTADFDLSVAGVSSLTYQGGTLNDTNGESDIYLAKYNNNGELIWVRTLIDPSFTGLNEERPTAICLDNNNNIYLTGFTMTKGFFVAKWNDTGVLQWTKYFNDVQTNNVFTYAIKFSNNSILITGFFNLTVDFNPSVNQSNLLTAFNNDGFLLSLNENGNFQWVKQFLTNGAVFLTGLETDNNNNIFISGQFVGDVDVNPSSSQTIISSLSNSFGAISSSFIAKFDNSGNLIWTNHLEGDSDTDFVYSLVKKDSNDNLVLASSFNGVASFSTTTTLDTNFEYISSLAKFDNGGNLLWADTIGKPVGASSGNSSIANMKIDACDRIIISGEFTGNCNFSTVANQGNLTTEINDTDVFIAMYENSGTYNWVIPIAGLGTPTFVEFNGYLPISIDNNNNLFISGSFRNTLDFDPTAAGVLNITSNSITSGIAGTFIAKYSNPIACNLGIESNNKKAMIIYPNPASEYFMIQNETSLSGISINIIDVSGKIVISKDNIKSDEIIIISDLNKGIYFVNITSDNFSKTEKLIIN